MSSETVATKPTKRRRTLELLRDILVILVVAGLVSFLVKTFFVRSFYIPSPSMEKTLLVNDRIIVDELTPRFNDYQRGDIVVFKDPGGWLAPQPPSQPNFFLDSIDWVLSLVGLSASDSNDHLIKRVIGLPGDKVSCCSPLGQLMVNGIPIDESSYINLLPGNTAASRFPFETTVPEGSLWVMGDNRDRSQDSRAHMDSPSKGFVPLDNVVGKAFFRMWPLDRVGGLDAHTEVFRGVGSGETTKK